MLEMPGFETCVSVGVALAPLTYDTDSRKIPPHSPCASIGLGRTMDLFNLSDESLLAYYESVRRQVVADHRLGGRRLVGSTVKQYAERLTGEMDRRRLRFQPIDWFTS
jgi:hypothetical protein